MIKVRRWLFTVPAQPKDSRVIVLSDFLYEGSFVTPRE